MKRLITATIVATLFVSGTASARGFTARALSPTWTSFSPGEEGRGIGYGISAIVEHEGALWIATEDHGLWRYSDGAFEDMSAHVRARHVRGIIRASDGALWFPYDRWGGGDSGSVDDRDGVALYRDGQWQQYDLPDVVLGGYARELGNFFRTRDDALWFFTVGRLLKFHDGAWDLIDGVERARHFLEARDGSIWVTGEDGARIWRSREGTFVPVTGGDGVTFQYPNTLVETADGTIWIGDSGLTAFKDGRYRRIEAAPAFDDNRIWPRFATRDGTLFVSSSGGGLYPFRDGAFQKPENDKRGFADPWIERRDGSVWYGDAGWYTNNDTEAEDAQPGIVSYADGVWQKFTTVIPNVVSSVHSLYEAADGSLWAGMRDGYIARYVHGEWFTIRRSPSNSNRDREAIATWADASDGSLWVGVRRGELRRFMGSAGTVRNQIVGAAAILTLNVTRGYTDPREWKLKYGFSPSPQTPPVEYFHAQFNAAREASIAVPESDQATFLYAVALDPDGTGIPLNETGWTVESVVKPTRSIEDTIDDAPPAGVVTQINGRAVDGEPLFRGSTEPFTDVLYSTLADGFHTFAVKAQTATAHVTIYKEKQLLRAFRPFGRSVAILIAVSAYPEASGYSPLLQAEPQARELEMYLKQNGFETITLYGPRATRENIRDTVTRLNLGPQDRLLVYFGGHGDFDHTAAESVGYVVPIDGVRARRATTAIRLSDFVGTYTRAISAKQILFVFDSCQSGFAIKRGDIDRAALRRLKAYQDIKYYAQRGRMILTAGSEGEAALDVNGGVFTRAFLAGIRGRADREVGDSNGVVDFYELFAYIHREVTQAAAARGYLQHPDFSVADGMGRFFFIYDRSLTQ